MTAPRKQIRPFHTVLVANRGEIAIRVCRTLRQQGYASVAVYSDADAHSPHVTAADRAVRIGTAAPRESYLNMPAILAAAQQAGADAVHPGYGFLAENAEFADAVDAAGLVFIGPSGAAIRAMGNKAQAKRVVMPSGMPCIPGYQGEDPSDEAFARAAQDIGYPVMVKAAAGGGGRGMRLVQEASQLQPALASARSEAAQAFGSDELILERAVIAPRHVEIQVLADSHGHVIHLGERDCSVQRRHQKVIEEAPSPAVDADLRARMGAAAVQAARAIGYIGAGTMEFLLDREGRFYFMEMNTRLQVEHAVTEAITGLDLVDWQLRIAAGERLTLQQSDVRFSGHAIEVRLTAEDVPAGFLPQTGPVLRWRTPDAQPGMQHRDGLRIDHGLVEGGEVSPHYDSMVAKLVAHGRTRDEARRRLQRAVEQCVLLGLPSNQGFLAECLADEVFAQGLGVHTGFVAERFPLLPRGTPPLPSLRTVVFAAFGAVCAASASPVATQKIALPALGQTHAAARLVLGLGAARWHVDVSPHGASWHVRVTCLATPEATPVEQEAVLQEAQWVDEARTVLRAACDGMVESAVLACHAGTTGQAVHVFHAARAWAFERIDPRKRRGADVGGGAVTAPLTGRIVEVAVQLGQQVHAGQKLVVLEAMKMEHTLTAAVAGEVSELHAQAGGQSAKGALLMRITP